MSDDQERVELRPDRGVESFGKSAYLRVRNAANVFRSSAMIALGLTGAIAVGMFFSKPSERLENGKEFSSPTISRDDPVLSPKLLTSRDLVAALPRGGRNKSALGKIMVMNLQGSSVLPVGSEAKAILVSGATDGMVKAKLTAPLLVDGEPALPENAVLFGKGKSGEDRLLVEFSRVVFPSGETYSIRAQAFDFNDRILGLKGTVVSKRAKKMAGAIGFGMIGGMADSLQSSNGSFMAWGQRPSARDAALAGAGKAMLDQSQAFIEEMKNSQPRVEVPAGTPLVIITDEPKPEEKP